MKTFTLITQPTDINSLSFENSHRAVELFVQTLPEWFPAQPDPMSFWPIHLMDWLIDYKKKMGIGRHRRIYLHSQYRLEAKRDGRVHEDDVMVDHFTLHVELRSINKPTTQLESLEMQASERTVSELITITITNRTRLTIITNDKLEVKSPDGVVTLESWKKFLQPDGQFGWKRVFYRKPETEEIASCPVDAQGARAQARGLLRRWIKAEAIETLYRKYFWLVIMNPKMRDQPAIKEQALLIQTIEEYVKMVPNPTEEEAKTYCLSVMQHEIDSGISIPCAKLRNLNLTITDFQSGRATWDDQCNIMIVNDDDQPAVAA